MFIIEYKKTRQCHIQEVNPSFLFELHQNMVPNEQYVTKMVLSANMGDLWGRFHCNILDNQIFTNTNLHLE
jgi:hypothetical protein